MSTQWTLDVQGFKPVSGVIDLLLPSLPQLWRVRHDLELGPLWRFSAGSSPAS